MGELPGSTLMNVVCVEIASGLLMAYQLLSPSVFSCYVISLNGKPRESEVQGLVTDK